MSQQAYEGTVVNTWFKAPWTMIKVAQKDKPLGLRDYTGPVPQPRQHISIEAKEGNWIFFGEHRSLVITDGKAPYPRFRDMPRDLMGELEFIVINRCRELEQVSSDDVHDDIIAVVQDTYSPKIVGMVFVSLAKKRIIHKVGRMKTKRPEGNAREIAVWELTKK